jgi:pimeloyl-ACP methyl ester carboxylesterase
MGRSGNRIRKLIKWLCALLLLVLLAVVFVPFAQISLALRLLSVIRLLAEDRSGKELPVMERVIHRRMGDRELEAIVYRPKDSLPVRALVLSHGISELGIHHPKLMTLSRALADAGFLVVTPDLPEFRELRLSTAPMEEMEFWFKVIPELEEGRKVRRAGLAGISFSGTLSLMAAAKPEIKDSVAFVLGIGSYSNLLDMMDEWFEPESSAEQSAHYSNRFYARWVIMSAALELLQQEGDRLLLQRTLLGLLKQKEVPQDSAELSPEGLRWLKLAVDRSHSDPGLADQIENYLKPLLYEQFDPGKAAAEVGCPVFLIHGAYDDLIPAEQSRKLKQRIVRARSYLLTTPFLTHTHAMEKPLEWSRKLSAAWTALIFLYDFAQTVV